MSFKYFLYFEGCRRVRRVLRGHRPLALRVCQGPDSDESARNVSYHPEGGGSEGKAPFCDVLIVKQVFIFRTINYNSEEQKNVYVLYFTKNLALLNNRHWFALRYLHFFV